MIPPELDFRVIIAFYSPVFVKKLLIIIGAVLVKPVF